jgi:hypothetical protein
MYFTLRQYFVQKKYVPHTINLPLPKTNCAPHGGRAPQFENLCSSNITQKFIITDVEVRR